MHSEKIKNAFKHQEYDKSKSALESLITFVDLVATEEDDSSDNSSSNILGSSINN